MEAFAITRLYTDENGYSRFEEITRSLESEGEIGFLSDPEYAEYIIFRKVKPTYDYDFHTAPDRQYLFLLDGGIEIETSLGEKRQFETGEVLLLEDTTGKGHKTRNLKEAIRTSVFITLK